MEYQYSTLQEEGTYDADGLCDGIPVRHNRYADLETKGILECQEDWSKLVAPLEGYLGGLGPKFGFMTVSLPECIPERLKIVSYATEFAFLYDDIVDVSPQEEVEVVNKELQKGFEEGSSGMVSRGGGAKRQIQAKIISKMMELDRERTMVSMKAWAKYIEASSARQQSQIFNTLEEYLPYRCTDAGQILWNALLTFGCGLTIPEEEDAICEELVKPAFVAASLTNDLYSFEKEYIASLDAGQTEVNNGVWVLMKEHNVSALEAKVLCRERIKEEVKKYIQIVNETIIRTDISEDARKYVELMQYSISGNVVWSLQCPRYNRPEFEKLNLAGLFRPVVNGINGTNKTRSATGIISNGLHDGLDTEPEGKSAASAQPPRKNKVVNKDDVNGATRNIPVSKPGFHQTSGPTTNVDPPASDVTALKIASLDPIGHCVVTKQISKLGDDLVLEPYKYLASLPSKGVRDRAIEALNFWLDVPKADADVIKSVISMLHSASLMLDDVEDGSNLRRGMPSTHVIFGTAQTINSSTFQYINAIVKLQELKSQEALAIFIEEVRALFVGQSYDIHWTREMTCPSIVEYLQMVDAKTGGLFRLLTRLLQNLSPHKCTENLDNLAFLFGRYFQVRDDYKNLTSTDYANQKGFCEDLDEGKFSLPLIHTFLKTQHLNQLRGLLQRRRQIGRMTPEEKKFILEHMIATGALDFTLAVLRSLEAEVEAEIGHLEKVFGKPNYEMRLLLQMLKV